MALRIAIDTGGTFTDLVLHDTDTGEMVFHKIRSTPSNPGHALVRGVSEIITMAAIADASIEFLVHGTTVATNAVLQRRGAHTALLTTSGFRDVLHIQRQDRPDMYDLRSRRAKPLVPRALRFEVNERVRHDGSVQTPLDTEQLESLASDLRQEGVEALAIAFLHSHTNPVHELSAGNLLARLLPDVSVCLSHDIVQEEGEYERFSTCAMNAFVQPVMAQYLQRVEAGLAEASIRAPLFVMKSNGGVMSAPAAARQSIHTILSGPAGGVNVGRELANAHVCSNLITADMGGTSFDVAVMHEGNITFARDAEIAGLAIKTPMLDIHTVGAGGGSIGWIDSGGALRVGPHSAGADPGPACYGEGGSNPTVTDANVVLGRIASDTILGGTVELDIEAAHRAVNDDLAVPMGLSIEAAAEGVLRVINATMTSAIRKLTVERGHDPRDFALCPFGGAGPLHATELAEEIGVKEIIIPLAPGVASAVGLLLARLREDRVLTRVLPMENIDRDRINADIRRLEAEASEGLASTGTLMTQVQLGLRYHGQGYDLPVEVDPETWDPKTLAATFHQTHENLYGFARTEQPVEMVNIRLSVEVQTHDHSLPLWPTGSNDPKPLGNREVIFRGDRYPTPIYQRQALGTGNILEGPAVIEQFDATTILWPGQQARIDPRGQLLLGQTPN